MSKRTVEDDIRELREITRELLSRVNEKAPMGNVALLEKIAQEHEDRIRTLEKHAE